MEELLAELKQLGITLQLHGEELRVSAPPGALNERLRQALRTQKEQLRSLLAAGAATKTAAVPAPAWLTSDMEQRHAPFALTELQRAYWIGRSGALEMGNVATHFYIELDCAELDMERLNHALCRLIDRHDMLRAVVDSNGMQRVLRSVPRYRIALDDQSAAAPDVVRSALAATRQALSHEVRQADQWPLFEVRATALPTAQVRLHVSLDLLILDAVSIFLFFQEWHQLYENPAKQQQDLQIQFRDFVQASQAQSGSEAYQRAHAYWMQRVDKLPAAPDLPMRSDPAARKAPRFSRRESRIEKPRWSKLKVVAQSQGLTPSTLLLAAYAEVLARWSVTPHFTLNVTVANRPPIHKDMQRVLGDFTSIVLCEVDRRNWECSFLEFAQSIQEQLLTDLEYRYVSGVSVQREWAKRQHDTLHATMPVVFSSGLSGTAEHEVGNLQQFGKKVYSISQTSQVWLDHHVVEVNGDLIFNWDAADAVFEDGVLDAMFSAYCGLVDRLCEDTSLLQRTNVTLLPPVMQSQRERANQTAHDVPVKKLHAGMVEHAQAHPNAIALLSSTRTLTYGELLEESAAVANVLLQEGIQPGQLVAVLMRKGWEQVVAVYGVLLAGGAYLPVDADLPPMRQVELLRIGEVTHVLTQDTHHGHDIEAGPWKLHAVRAGAHAAYSAQHAAHLAGDLDQLAYVIFTSGTTGTPKGVMVGHRAAMNTIQHVNRLFGLGPQDRVLSVSSLSFDLSVYDIFGMHAAGAALVLPDRGKSNDAMHWRSLMATHRVTVWNSAPQLMKMLVDSFGAHDTAPAPLLITLLSGDFIPLALPDQIRLRYALAQVISLGGATEASIWSIYYPVHAIDTRWSSIPYGMPLPNQTVWVYDSALRPCPDHVKGRIYIGGIGLASGYWRDAQKTEARFITHPKTRERLYDTGDLGRYAPGGLVTILGREDGQVKIRGHRVELGEVEAILNQYAGIRQAVVVATPGQAGERQLLAYIAPHGQDFDQPGLRTYLSQRLPDYMVPRHLMLIDALPLSANGKVNYRALPDYTGRLTDLTEQHRVAPRNAIEQALCEAWSRVIVNCDIGVTDNFFDLGVDSVVATQMVREMNAALPDFKVEMHELFEALTIEALATLYHARAQHEGPHAQEDQTNSAEVQAKAMMEDVRIATEGFAQVDFSRLPGAGIATHATAKTLLLTGTTGWVGSHVLHTLMRTTSARVVCLVRKRSNAENSRARLVDAMRNRGLAYEPAWDARLDVIDADLEAPQLGLAPEDWARLAESVDAIYHLGASLNVMADYTAHRRVNIESVATVVRLATQHHIKPVYVCSPMAVSRRQTAQGVIVLHEECAHPDPLGIPTGYAQSKWVAEQVLLAAKAHGLPVKIYRTSHALPSSRGGYIKPNDTYTTILQTAYATGVIPDWADSALHGVPVDVLAGLLVEDSLRHNDHHGIVHLENRTPSSLKTILGELLQDGTRADADVPTVNLDEWRNQCLAAAASLPPERASLATFLFTQRADGSAVEFMFSAHPIDTGYFERLGQSSALTELTPAAYWRQVCAGEGWSK